jgi:hypothetical protein
MNNELEDRLAESLHASAAGVRTADVANLAVRARAGHRRRLLAIRGTLTVCAAAGTTAVLVVTLAAPSAPGVLNPQTAAYVTSMTERALGATANDDFVFVRTTVGGPGAPVSYDAPGTRVAGAENWSYGRHRRMEIYAAHGRPIADVAAQAGPKTTTMTTVVYGSATWWRSHIDVAYLKVMPTTRCSPFGLLGMPLGVTGLNPSWPELFRRALACGQVVETGRQVIDGQRVIRLEQKARAAAWQSVYWVNSSTYLPVRIQTYTTEVYAVQDFRWMRPTAANLAQLGIAIPAGFSRVNAPRYAGLIVILPVAAVRLP